MKKILVIEDDKNICENICQILQMNDFEVIYAMNGEDGITKAKLEKPNLIVSDIMLPGIDGYEVKEKLSKVNSTKMIPFIFLSAKTELADIRRGMNTGADDYLTKPFKAKELLEAIKTRLERIENFRNDNQKRNGGKSNLNDKIFIYSGKDPLLIDFASILFIEAQGEYSFVHLTNGKKNLVRKLLKDWEIELPQNEFLRIHRSVIINLNQVKRISKVDVRNYQVYLNNYEKPLSISQRYSVKIKRYMGI